MATNERISIREWPTEHARRAYDSGFRLEALQVLHGFIECKLQEILILNGATRKQTMMEQTWDIANQIPLLHAARCLYVQGDISKALFDSIALFNSMRNKLTHRIFVEPYSGNSITPTHVDCENAFTSGCALCDELQAITEDMIE